MNDPDVKIDIAATYDGTAATEAKADIAATTVAAEEAAATAGQTAKAQEQAVQKSAAATDRETEKQQMLAEAMRLTAMGKRTLVEEIKNLTAARKAAAAAGDQKQYEKLTQSLNMAKQAMEGVNTAQAMAQISTMQQAQAGMQMAQGFASLGGMAKNAGSNIAGMAAQVIGLGMAMKAGLGPVGWAMAALQGLQMVITKYITSNKEAAQAVKDFAAAAQDAYEKVAESARKIAEARMTAEEREQDAAVRKAKEAADKKLRQMDAEGKAAEEHRQAELKRKRAALDAEIALEEEKANAPGGDKGAFEKWRQGKEEEYRREEVMAREAAEREAAERRKVELDAAGEIAAIRHKALDEYQDKFQGLATMNDADRDLLQKSLAGIDELKERRNTAQAQVEDINKQMEAMKKADNDEEVDRLRRKREAVAAELSQYQEQIADKVKELDAQTAWMNALIHQSPETLHMAVEDQKRWALNVALAADKKEEAVRLADEEVEHLQDAAAAAERSATVAEKTAQADESLRKTQAEIAVRRAETDQKRLDAEKAKKDQETKAQQATAAAHKEQAELARQWTQVQYRALSEQETWLRETIAHMQEGSEEAAKWAEQLHNVTEKRIQESLSAMADDFKVTGSYTAQDRRMQGEILAADGRALAARAQRLRQLMAETQDEATRRQITKQLEETEKQQRGLAEATRQAAQEARKSLKNYAPPEFQSKNRMVQRNLDNTAHAYARLAKTAERQAEAGNTKGLERTKRLMQNYADRLGRLGHDQQKANDLFRRDADLLDQIAASDSKRKKHADKREKAERKSADASKKQADLKDAQSAPDKAAQEQQDTKAALENARAALEQNEKALGEMQARVAEALALAARVAGAAESIAKAAGKSVAALKKRCTALEKDVENLWSEVDA